MTDLHTHILPGMDDGARDVTESLALLSMEREQGVDTVCLTPHFYPEREAPEEFLQRRAAAYGRLRAVLPADAPTLYLGAEVAWFPTIGRFEALTRLTLGESSFFLLELPFEPWTTRLLDDVYRLPDTLGLTPILAHVERFYPLQGRSRMRELFSLGFPMQMNASSVTGGGRRALSLLKDGDWRIASDCHDLRRRPPEMARAAAILRARFGPGAEEFLSCAPFEA